MLSHWWNLGVLVPTNKFTLDVQWVHNNQSPWVQTKLCLPSKFRLQNKICIYVFMQWNHPPYKNIKKRRILLKISVG